MTASIAYLATYRTTPEWAVDLALAQGRPIGGVLLGQWLASLKR